MIKLSFIFITISGILFTGNVFAKDQCFDSDKKTIRKYDDLHFMKCLKIMSKSNDTAYIIGKIIPHLEERGETSRKVRNIMYSSIDDKRNSTIFRVSIFRASGELIHEINDTSEVRQWENLLKKIISDLNNDADVRKFAIKKIKEIKSDENYEVLRKTLSEAEPNILSATGRALETYLLRETSPAKKSEFFNELKTTIENNKNNNLMKIRSLFFALAVIREDYSKNFLVSLLENPDYKEVRPSIILSLDNYNDKDVYYKVLESFDVAKTDGEKYKVDAEDMFKVITKDNKEEFYKLLDDNSYDKLKLLEGIQHLGQRNNGAQIREKVFGFMTDTDPDIRIKTVHTLPYLYDFDELHIILQPIYDTETDEKVKREIQKVGGFF